MDVGRQTLNAFETRVDEVLQRKISSFRRIFISTAVTGLVLFSFIVLPYVSSHTARSELMREAKTLMHQIELSKRLVLYHGELIKQIGRAMHSADRMYHKFVDFDYHRDLREQASQQRVLVAGWKQELEDVPDAAAWINGDVPRPLLSDLFYHRNLSFKKWFKDPCFWLDAELWTYCRISQDLTRQHIALRQNLGGTDSEFPPGLQMRELKETLNKHVEPFARWATDPDPDNTAEIDAVRVVLSHSLQSYKNAIFDAERALQESQADVEAQQDQMKTEHEQTQDKVAIAEAKLDQARKFETIETPIGNLPVGLDELVLLFPSALLLVMYYLIVQLEQAMELRRTLHLCLIQRYVDLPGGAIQFLRMTSSLWLEPFDPRLRQTVQVILLAVPALTALFASYLVLDSDFLYSDTVVPETTTLAVFVLGYAASIWLLVTASQRLFTTAKEYRAEYL